MRPDDCSVTPEEYANLREHARAALERSSAIGRFPTPVDEIMDSAKVAVAEQDALDERFLRKLRRATSGALRRALSKVRGVLDVVARLVYLDRTVYVARRTFLKLHETAHAVLPHQRDLYQLVEDCEKTIAPDVADQFDREANVFATEVLFQLDGFIEETRDEPFGVLVPVRFSKKYGASIYASVRQYVCKHHRACCVLILDPPELRDGIGFSASVRRVVASPSFHARFGRLRWPEHVTPGDQIGSFVPINGRKMSRPREIELIDANGVRHECVAEAFTQSKQVFVMIHAVATLTRNVVQLP